MMTGPGPATAIHDPPVEPSNANEALFLAEAHIASALAFTEGRLCSWGAAETATNDLNAALAYIKTGRRLGRLAGDCAACAGPADGNASIHRDGFCEGPEVELCDACGLGETPTVEELWEMIARRDPQRSPQVNKDPERKEK
jgi:hypothetical protein